LNPSARVQPDRLVLSTLTLVLLLSCTLCGCLATIPSSRSQESVPPDIKQVFNESGDRYLQEAEAALARARAARSEVDARREQSEAWRALQAAWERHVLSGDPAGIARVLRAAALAEPGDPPEAVDEPLALFGEMVKRIRGAEDSLSRSPPVVSTFGELHDVAREAAADFVALKRAFAIEREIWGLEDDARGDSEHLRHLEELLRAAELSPALRGKVPYKWSREAAAGLRVQK